MRHLHDSSQLLLAEYRAVLHFVKGFLWASFAAD